MESSILLEKLLESAIFNPFPDEKREFTYDWHESDEGDNVRMVEVRAYSDLFRNRL